MRKQFTYTLPRGETWPHRSAAKLCGRSGQGQERAERSALRAGPPRRVFQSRHRSLGGGGPWGELPTQRMAMSLGFGYCVELLIIGLFSGWPSKTAGTNLSSCCCPARSNLQLPLESGWNTKTIRGEKPPMSHGRIPDFVSPKALVNWRQREGLHLGSHDPSAAGAGLWRSKAGHLPGRPLGSSLFHRQPAGRRA